jgi:hypothetical protein
MPVRVRLDAPALSRSNWLRWSFLAAPLAVTSMATAVVANGPLPTGGQYVAGTGSIASSRSTVTISQSSSIGIINWQNFSIGTVHSGDISNTGRINAVVVALSSAGGNIYALGGNREGLIQATGTAVIDGQVWLTAPQGEVRVSGTLTGGEVSISGETVVLAPSAVIHVSGNAGGGIIQIGGGTGAVSNDIGIYVTAANGSVATSGAGTVSLIGTGGDTGGSGDANYGGTNALATTGSGRFLVWSTAPAADNRGGVAYGFIQYGAAYGSTTPADLTRNGFLYSSIGPSLNVVLIGTVSKTYDTTDTASIAAGNLSVTGMLNGDTVIMNPDSGTYDTSQVGSGEMISVTGLLLSGPSAADYRLVATSMVGPIGVINATPTSNAARDFSAEITALVSARLCPALSAGSTAPVASSCGASALSRAPDRAPIHRHHLLINLPPEIDLDGRPP